jgi:hypothetical protein
MSQRNFIRLLKTDGNGGYIPLVPPIEYFQRLQRLTDYEKLKKSYYSICRMIEGMGNINGSQSPPRTARQDMEQQYDKHCAIIWQRQKTNLEEKMRVLENSIKQDIEDSKNEL